MKPISILLLVMGTVLSTPFFFMVYSAMMFVFTGYTPIAWSSSDRLAVTVFLSFLSGICFIGMSFLESMRNNHKR